MEAEPVTVTIAFRVAQGHEPDFHSWALQELAESSLYGGHLGGGVLAPGDGERDWRIVISFDDEEAARRWEDSFMRTRSASLARSVRWQVGKARISGPPTVSRRRGPPAVVPAVEEERAPEPPPAPPTPPPKWKMAIVTLSAVFPPVLFFNLTVIPFLGGFSVVARSAALCVAVTAVTTYVLMPRLMKLYKTFLYPLAGRQRAAPPGRVLPEYQPAPPERLVSPSRQSWPARDLRSNAGRPPDHRSVFRRER